MSAAAINVPVALERLDGDMELLVELSVVLVEELPNLRQTLSDAISSGDAHQIERAAHSLKGAVSNLAADNAYTYAGNLEAMGRENTIADATEMFSKLEQELNLVVIAAQELTATNA